MASKRFEIAGRNAHGDRDLDQKRYRAAEALDWLIAHTPFGEPRLESLAVLLRGHLAAYADSLSRWDGWQPVDLYRDTDSEPLVQAWFRPEDHWVAADFVGLVHDPKNLERPSREYGRFAADAVEALEWLEDNVAGTVRGIRLWILRADDLPVVRWLTPDYV